MYNNRNTKYNYLKFIINIKILVLGTQEVSSPKDFLEHSRFYKVMKGKETGSYSSLRKLEVPIENAYFLPTLPILMGGPSLVFSMFSSWVGRDYTEQTVLKMSMS